MSMGSNEIHDHIDLNCVTIFFLFHLLCFAQEKVIHVWNGMRMRKKKGHILININLLNQHEHAWIWDIWTELLKP